jgi:predicted nucleic acid-binding protein
MKKSVYLDTTIPSYYYEERTELALRQKITQQWWNEQSQNYSLYISEIVLLELNRGYYPHKNEIISLVNGFSVLEVSDEISDIVQIYIAQNIMPIKDPGDALHLALASYHKMDFLLTWNCKNIANANKFEHIRIINTQLGLYVPQIVTPEQLFMEGSD